ncbi:type I toxin-antitoxin system Ibs family toxin, partial [Escherichia coli]|nr:type I toxin-antitoxin system Ibs family toxin [Escherichia coli]EKH9957269.1 type I toxin-antitoxin system Ibs family toxin [Escherichia coli]MCN4693674.1 type I toxin-antitoxin system Ibs family toxin [Escherichia coli]MCV1596706.1 type I toxin-antitoxin system Ibs family toxin [Escherichia coli]MDU1472353.1 type I toxin-antitoxin system Ibs family toxin [Escherichia coli]
MMKILIIVVLLVISYP